VKQFYERGSSVGSNIDIAKEFCGVHHKKGADLFAFPFNDVGHDGIEQRHTRFHALFEHDFEGGELFLDGFFNGV
jgi:hypothetical protein